MKPYKSSIKRKVIRVILLTSITTLLVTVVAFMVYDLVTFRKIMVQNLGIQARMIADNSTAALAFRNETDAANVLASLRSEPQIVAAAIYDGQGKLFAKYPAQVLDADLPGKPQARSHQFEKSHLILFQPVIQSGTKLGTLYLKSDVTALSQRLQLYGAISLFIMTGSLLITLWLSTTLQRRISNPIVALAETARAISSRQDFSVRAKKISDDELGDLTDAFNTMLNQIQTTHFELGKSRAHLQLVTDYASVLLCHVDRTEIFHFVNPAYAARFSLTPQMVIGRQVREVVGLTAYESFRDHMQRVLAGEHVDFEKEIPYENIGPRWMHCIYIPEKDGTGEVVGFVGVINDITSRKQQEAELSRLVCEKDAQARLFDATLSSITDLAYTFDLEGNWIYANKPLLQIWGKPLAEITGKSSLDLGYPPELAARLKQQVKEVVQTGKPVRGETYFKDAAGIEDYHEYIFSPVLAADGSVTAVCGTTRLTTERKRAEAVAESQRRVLQLIAEDAPLPQVLDELMRTVELGSSSKIFASVLLLDPDGIHLRHGAAPSLPAAYCQALDGIIIGPSVGSCGTAAFLKKPVYVADIATDPLWAAYKDLALAHGLRACWSIPITSTRGEVLGTFTMYHPEPRAANLDDLKVVEMATRTASIAIERKHSDAAVRDSERRYSQMVNSLPAAVYTTDAQGRITLYNDAAAILWGRKPEVGKDLWCGSDRIYRPDGTPLPPEECPMAMTLKKGLAVRGEEILIERPDRTRRNVLPYPDLILDASGKTIGAINMLLDITESKRAEEASRRLAAIVEFSDDAILSKDLNSIITSWNRGAERMFGYQAEEMIGKPITLLMPEDRWNEEPNILDRIRRGQPMEHYETVRRRKDGSLVEISLTVSPIRDTGGKIIGASKIVRDIGRQNQAKRELEQAHQEAVAASRAKDDFLAALSHELRTPLNPVLLLASAAAEDLQLPAEVRAQFVTIRNNVELEARLIDDLLDITRVTHGKLSLAMDWVDVNEVLNTALTTVKPELDKKRITLKLNLAGDALTLKGDAVRLQQVFWNVIKNAVKFTPEGGKITIETFTTGNDGKITVKIIDTGIGMTIDEISRIFKAFSQGDHAGSGGSHRFGGLGLGLSISRMLVELHGGEISATSAGLGQGATFIILLPLRQAPAGKGSSPSSGELVAMDCPAALKKRSGMRILLVEDHEATRTALAHLLTRRGYKVITATSVAEARAAAQGEKFDLVVSDIGLPDGNGYALMSELREKFSLKGIALSGYGMEQDVKRGQNAGFIAHLIKPVRVESLEKALSEIT